MRADGCVSIERPTSLSPWHQVTYHLNPFLLPLPLLQICKHNVDVLHSKDSHRRLHVQCIPQPFFSVVEFSNKVCSSRYKITMYVLKVVVSTFLHSFNTFVNKSNWQWNGYLHGPFHHPDSPALSPRLAHMTSQPHDHELIHHIFVVHNNKMSKGSKIQWCLPFSQLHELASMSGNEMYKLFFHILESNDSSVLVR